MAEMLGVALEMQKAHHAGLISLLEKLAVGPSLRLEPTPDLPCLTLERAGSAWTVEVTAVGLSVTEAGAEDKAAKAWMRFVENRASVLEKAVVARLEGVEALPAAPVSMLELAESLGVHPATVDRLWTGKRVGYNGEIAPLATLLPLLLDAENTSS